MIDFFAKWITPNQLTVTRIVLIPVICVLMVIGENIHWLLFTAWGFFAFACLTDYWDGVLARYQGKSTKLGKLLDPVADKILIASVLIIIVSFDRAPSLLVVVLIAREFAISGLRSIAVTEGIVIAASSGGKWKTISQMFASGFLMIHYRTLGIPCHDVGIILLWIATAISIWSGVRYFMAYYHSHPSTEEKI